MSAYTAVCEREGDWWVVRVPELGGRMTQARRLDQVDAAVRSLVSLIAEIPADSFEVDLRPQMPANVAEEVWQARELREQAETVQADASGAMRRAAADLAGLGLTVRDVGATLGVSAQRASQLLASQGRGSRSKSRRGSSKKGARVRL
jgi:hypothetical protein